MNIKNLTLIAAWLLCHTASAQIFEPFNVRYRYAHPTDVSSSDTEAFEDAERDDFQFIEVMGKFPIIFKNNDALILPELIYKSSDYRFVNWSETLATPDRSQLLRFSLKGVFPLNEKWNLLAIGYASQGNNQGVDWDLSNNVYRGGLGFLVDNQAGNQIGASLLYVSEVNLPVLVFLYKGRSASGRWQFNVEAPQLSIVEYVLSPNSRIRLEQKLDNERYFYGNNQRPEDSYNVTNLNVALGFSQRLFGPAYVNLSAGLTPLNLLIVYDQDDDALETLTFDVQPTISAGFYISVNPDDYVGDD